LLLFVILRVCEFVWPTTTDLKSITDGTTEIFAAEGSAEDFSAETEAQPEKMLVKTTAHARRIP
jgi:hypothetical protein